MRLSLIVVCAALAIVFAAPGHSSSAHACAPLGATLLGGYQRVDDTRWKLTFEDNCTFRVVTDVREEGGGDYTVTETGVDTDVGVIVFSNDRGCREPGVQDLPTPYTFSFERGVLTLAVQGGAAKDLCVNAQGEGRPRELEGHGGWLKSIAGTVALALKGKKRGSFSASGAFADRGTFRVLRSAKTKKTKRASLRLSSPNGTFTFSERVTLRGKRKGRLTWDVVGAGSGAYAGLTGTGTGRASASRQSLRGDVSN